MLLYIVLLYVQIMPLILNTQNGNTVSYSTTQNSWITTFSF